MAAQEMQGQVPKETLYEKLVSLVGSQYKVEQIRNLYPDSEFRKQRQGRISFCKVVSREWIISILSNYGIANGGKARFIDLTNEEKIRFVELRRLCLDEQDIEIYFYFIYFSGLLFLFTEKEFKHGLYGLRKFFEDKVKGNRSLLFRFITAYIDLVDPNKRDIEEYRQLKECLVEDHDNILFDLFDKDLELLMEILQKTVSDFGGYRCDIIREQIFPGIEDGDFASGGEKNVIRSIIQSGIAKLYFIAGREREHIERLTMALSPDKGYPHNSFALVQTAHILAQRRVKLSKEFDSGKVSDERGEEEGDEDDDNIIHKRLLNLIKTANFAVRVKLSYKDPISTSERLFKKAIVLIKDEQGKGQFKAFSPVNYRVLLEAVLGLAYIDFLRGHDNEAKQKYKEAEEIINNHLKDNKQYLTSILMLNSGRNKLDNGSKEDDDEARSDFRKVIDIYEKASDNIKKELAEIAARAYNNLGIYYLNEADYDQAEKCFRQSMEIDYNNAFARYNLGILYYKREDKTRAITLFKNAHYIDPNFSEARVALDKLGALKKESLGSDWFSWWFEKNTMKKEKKRTPLKRVSIFRPIIALVAIVVIIASLGGLAIELVAHHLAGVHTHASNHNPTPYLAMTGASIAILLLPFINKLKVSDIEIELETAGYRPVAPSCVSEGIADSYYDALKYRFLFPPFWYPFGITNARRIFVGHDNKNKVG
jgi:tetratricopeptide (TPR) repeat protein